MPTGQKRNHPGESNESEKAMAPPAAAAAAPSEPSSKRQRLETLFPSYELDNRRVVRALPAAPHAGQSMKGTGLGFSLKGLGQQPPIAFYDDGASAVLEERSTTILYEALSVFPLGTDFTSKSFAQDQDVPADQPKDQGNAAPTLQTYSIAFEVETEEDPEQTAS